MFTIFVGTDVGVLIKLTETLHEDLLIGKAVYHAIFMKILDIDYLSYVSVILEKHLANDANATMKKANILMNNMESEYCNNCFSEPACFYAYQEKEIS